MFEAKLIGAGAATIALAGAAIGIGNVFSALIHSVARNPKQLFGYAILGFALTEAIALFALMMAFLIQVFGLDFSLQMMKSLCMRNLILFLVPGGGLFFSFFGWFFGIFAMDAGAQVSGSASSGSWRDWIQTPDNSNATGENLPAEEPVGEGEVEVEQEQPAPAQPGADPFLGEMKKNLNGYLKENLKEMFNKTPSQKKCDKIVEVIVGPQLTLAKLTEIFSQIEQNPGANPPLFRARRMLTEIYAKNVKDRDLSNFQFDENEE